MDLPAQVRGRKRWRPDSCQGCYRFGRLKALGLCPACYQRKLRTGTTDPAPRPAAQPAKTWTQWLSVVPALHPDTDPEAVRAAQRRDVSEARDRLGAGATAESIAADVCLAAWRVEQYLRGE